MSLHMKDPSWLVKGSLAFATLGALTVYGLARVETTPSQQDSGMEYRDIPGDEANPTRVMLPGVPLLPGSTQTDPILMTVNGSRTNVTRSWVNMSPLEIVNHYEKMARSQGAQDIRKGDSSVPDEAGPFSPACGPNLPTILSMSGQALRADTELIHAITWIDKRGWRISVHTLAGEQRSSWYFVMQFENPQVLFNNSGVKDNPGTDCSGIPRPPQARRILSISGYGVDGLMTAVYESNGSAELTHRFYEASMPSQGWEPTVLPEPGRTIIGRSGGQVFRKDRTLACVYTDEPATHVVRTSLVLFEMP